MAKRLYRNGNDRKIAGVCSGIAAYFNIDPTIVRLVWVALALMAGGGIILYLVAWFLIPERY